MPESKDQKDEMAAEPEQEQVPSNSDSNKLSPDMDKILSIDIDLVEPDPDQPRKYFEPVALEELKQSIGSNTLIDPIIVRKSEQKPGSYLIVDGERRWRACKDLNHAQIKCRVIPTALNHELVAFSQNVHRADLTIMEKAEHLGKLFSRIKSDKNDAQQKDLLPLVNLSESYISELMKISKLDDEIKTEALRSRSWTRAKLMQLADIKKPEGRLKKFKEFKSLLYKHDRSENKTDESIGEATSQDSQDHEQSDSASGNESQQRKITRFKKHADAFTKKLERLKKANLETADLKIIISDLDRIAHLIHGILS
jgi:ParB family chromosome partitioning protein